MSVTAITVIVVVLLLVRVIVRTRRAAKALRGRAEESARHRERRAAGRWQHMFTPQHPYHDE